MYTSEGAPDFVVDQGLYYPLDATYGYYSTGYESSPGEWENHQMFFGVDGSQVQYTGGQNENSPYICYQPSYAYAQSPYNPFNPYIPGASVGVGSQQFYSVPPYQNVASTFAPYATHPDIISSTSANSLVETGSANRGRSDGRGSRQRNVSTNARNPPKVPALNSFGGISEKSRSNVGQSKQPEMDRSVSTPSSGPLSQAHISHDTVDDHSRGPRSKGLRNQLIVKAYTTKVGNADAEGNIVIDPNQYNKEDLRVDYSSGKFFVIKSYSEDDVHKSIKYSVWSSTLHGNKKLQSAYEDAQRIATEKSCECPIFLFFSVNASGLFCGMAEMIGPVSFDKDMDFWQQDKWSGSFPVKWHIIKDVPNSYFRHIILQNNENKPVTNSRDTQEIMLKQGLEVLKIFKGHAERTSLLDDFVYYENRQRVMYDERTRLPYRTFLSPSPLPRTDTSERNKKTSMGSFKTPSVTSAVTGEVGPKVGDEEEDPTAIEKKIRSLSINSSGTDSQPTSDSPQLKESEAKCKQALQGTDKKTEPSEAGGACVSDDIGVVKVGSVPVKVTGSAAILTVGTIPLDPKTLEK